MGTDQDRARVRRRLASAAVLPPSARVGSSGRDHDDDSDNAVGEAHPRAWAPEWLAEATEADDFSAEPGPERPSPRWPGARLSPGRRGAAALVVVALVAAGIAAVTVWRDRPTAQVVPPLPAVEVRDVGAGDTEVAESVSPQAALPAPPEPAAQVVVSVVGLVNQAGLVLLPPGSRIADALAAAGGPRPGADVLGLNMAERVDDGDQILVGVAPAEGAPVTVGSARVSSGASAAAATPGATAKAVAKVNLNTAGEAELDALPGVGPVTAAAIVAWRQTNGKFTDIAQLGEVDGIGPARLAKLRELVVL
ncbi:ComEA family DNA-binding protein [Rhodococcus sp. AG1013]|uniref:ComEA family DNA-binding protein n=1 Tax=unclassified Rhodococcus (in: high G+C Gram-positive bacteria) TaxID=192944 RepID=UPI000E0CA61D|nr:ComEA family DNA-binding protein [Rhodococcus sp. AG1013]